MSIPAITPPMKANWAVANAIEQRRLELNPALRRAYTRESFSAPNADALREAKESAERIARTLQAGLDLLAEGEA